MQLSYNHHQFQLTEFKRLGFSNYLARFNHLIPILDGYQIEKMDKRDAILHYDEIGQLENRLANKTTEEGDLSKLLEISSQLPTMNDFFAHLDSGLRSDHLFTLHHFLKAASSLELIDPILPEGQSNFIPLLVKLLENNLSISSSGATSLQLSAQEEILVAKTKQLTKEISTELSQLEQQVFKQHQLEMLYPYPKELPIDHPKLAEIEKSLRLEVVTKQAGSITVTLKLTAQLLELIEQKERVQKELALLAASNIEKIITTVRPKRPALENYYQLRVKRSFHYLLLNTKLKDKLIWPTFCHHQLSAEKSWKIKEAILPILQQKTASEYVPLTLKLNRATSLLTGANMAGKSTVLRTLYFHLTLIQMGLPLPAKEFTTPYPSSLQLILNSSGSVGKGESALACELQALGLGLKKNGIILVDELLSSTTTTVAKVLIKALRQEICDQGGVLLATTHIPEVLHHDLDQLLQIDQQFTPLDISPNKLQAALQTQQIDSLTIAANSAHLPTTVKNRILKTLSNWEQNKTET
ncbi:MAG: hypothetical protein HN353_07175 [Bdellovibrionales bacterium]|jgi:DNA mismatch repair ATPase MutS|nr:hypothetical protein [Bdellovibrionales bacterium]MBT3526591.1 hypothetical protein [Bdellovibrionales bacterium]MBT7670154.1 hypothetical protein [Bdellovibrionales bacterium]MBT7768232.1 hypothetical protein [Bdellovibrionales bacterium]